MTQPTPTTSPILTIPTSIDYTSRDYVGLVQSLLIYAGQIFPDWNTGSEGDFGVMLLELFAYVGDILSYYTDRVAQEAYLPTATQRLSLFNIAAMLGYVPSNGVPASGTITFVTEDPGVAVIVPAGTQVGSTFDSDQDGPVIYQTVDVVTVPDNGGTVTTDVVQGETYNQVNIGVSDGTAGQQYLLPSLNVLDGSTQIFLQTTTGTEEWIQVGTFIDSTPGDKVFMVNVDANGNTIVTFGDGGNGLIPALSLNIYATYTVIVGAAGNQPAGSVNTIVSGPNNAEPPLGFSVALDEAGIPLSSIMAGGADPESNDSIRANAPMAYATQDRAISLTDYADLALSVPGVILANAVAYHSTAVSLYFLGQDGSAPSQKLQDAVQAYFTGPPQRMGAGVSLSTPAPSLVPVNVGSIATPVQLQVKAKFPQTATLANVQTTLTALLNPPNVVFGQLLQVSSLYEAIMAVAGVDYVIIPVMTRTDNVQTDCSPIQFRPSEVPTAGTFTITANGGV